MNLKVSIPVKPYLHKYIVKRIGSHELKATLQNAWGIQLINSFTQLSYKPSHIAISKEPVSKVNYKEIQVELTFSPETRSSYMFSNNTILQFERIVDEYFRHDLMMFLVFKKTHTGSCKVKPSVLDFLGSWGITEDELDLDTILRYYRRHIADYSSYKLKL